MDQYQAELVTKGLMAHNYDVTAKSQIENKGINN